MAAVSEALALGQALGLDPRTLSAVFNAASARCWSSEAYNPCPGVMGEVRAPLAPLGPPWPPLAPLGPPWPTLLLLLPPLLPPQQLPRRGSPPSPPRGRPAGRGRCRAAAARGMSGALPLRGARWRAGRRAQVPSARGYQPGFGVQLMLKDLGLALQVGPGVFGEWLGGGRCR
jgi:hypothetical protein